MTNTGTDVANPRCKTTHHQQGSERHKYDDGENITTYPVAGRGSRQFSGSAGKLTTAATFSGAVSGNSENHYCYHGVGTNKREYITNGSGVAVYTITNPPQGTLYAFGATFQATDGNNSVTATVTWPLDQHGAPQSGFDVISPGVKTYGDSDFRSEATGPGELQAAQRFSVPSGNGVS